MIKNPRPTRAEILNIAKSILKSLDFADVQINSKLGTKAIIGFTETGINFALYLAKYHPHEFYFTKSYLI